MFIKNPHNPCSRFTEKGILAKLKRTPGTLKYINDPTEEVNYPFLKEGACER